MPFYLTNVLTFYLLIVARDGDILLAVYLKVFVRAASEPRDIHSTPRVFPGPAYARHRYAYHRASSVPRFTSYHHEPSHSRFSAYHEPSHVRYSMYHAPSIEHHVFHRPTYTPYHWYSGAASLGDLYSAPSFRHRMRDDFHRSWYQPTFKVGWTLFAPRSFLLTRTHCWRQLPWKMVDKYNGLGLWTGSLIGPYSIGRLCWNWPYIHCLTNYG